MADRAIYRYALMSTEELDSFPKLWNVDPQKGRFCPYFFTVDEYDLSISAPEPQDIIFAGGNSFRDYDTLLQVARQMPDHKFVIATKRLNGRMDIPKNVTIKFMGHREFMQTLRSASVVVVPIKKGLTRAVGQQTYLNAMWLGKPTIVNEALGVFDHVEPGKTAVVVDGSVESYVAALQWAFDPQNILEVNCLKKQAHKIVDEQFIFENHVLRLLQIVDEAILDWHK